VWNVIIGIEACHVQKLGQANVAFAEFKITIASLNLLANTTFPKEFERSAANIAVLQRYLRTFPIRLHREGYTVDDKLRRICKTIAKSNRNSNGGASSSSTHRT
jgi:hypothetical protein